MDLWHHAVPFPGLAMRLGCLGRPGQGGPTCRVYLCSSSARCSRKSRCSASARRLSCSCSRSRTAASCTSALSACDCTLAISAQAGRADGGCNPTQQVIVLIHG